MIKNRLPYFITLSLLLHTSILISAKMNYSFNFSVKKDHFFTVDLYKNKTTKLKDTKKTNKYSENINNNNTAVLTNTTSNPSLTNTDTPSLPIELKEQRESSPESNQLKEKETHQEKPSNITQSTKTEPQQIKVPEKSIEKEFKKVEPFDKEAYSRYLIAVIQEKIEYPYLARKRGIEGDLLVMVTISTSGKLEDINIIQSSGYKVLDEHTLELSGKLTFDKHPPVNIKIPIKINYRLNK